MIPGRDLDAKIATEIFGWTDIEAVVVPYEREPVVQGTRPDGSRRVVPEYSSKIEFAWEVVEKFGFSVVKDDGGWWAGEIKWDWPHHPDETQKLIPLSEAPALAICLAALNSDSSAGSDQS